MLEYAGLTIVKHHDVFGKLISNEVFMTMSAVNEVKKADKKIMLRILKCILKAMGTNKEI